MDKDIDTMLDVYMTREQRAAYDRLTRDAERWRHARKLLAYDEIERAQKLFDSFGGLVSQYDCLRADEAIDMAMQGANAAVKPRSEAESA